MGLTDAKKAAIVKELESKNISFQTNKSMVDVTTFAIGGPAPVFIEPTSAEEIKQTVEIIRETEVPFYVLGRGSNVLFPDEPFGGVVIHIGKKFSAIQQQGNHRFSVESGALLTDFAGTVGKEGCTGLEFAYGIPGSVGGGVYMNAGAYGGEMKDVLSKITYLELSGEEKEIVRSPSMEPDAFFYYRHSFFTDHPAVILTAEVDVELGYRKEIVEKMETLMSARREKQPLEYPSAGSVFKRPAKGYASALIDECGLKGARIGGAEVSEKHAGFIINRGGATAKDVLALIDKIQNTVLEKTGILLECELKVTTPMNPW